MPKPKSVKANIARYSAKVCLRRQNQGVFFSSPCFVFPTSVYVSYYFCLCLFVWRVAVYQVTQRIYSESCNAICYFICAQRAKVHKYIKSLHKWINTIYSFSGVVFCVMCHWIYLYKMQRVWIARSGRRIKREPRKIAWMSRKTRTTLLARKYTLRRINMQPQRKISSFRRFGVRSTGPNFFLPLSPPFFLHISHNKVSE